MLTLKVFVNNYDKGILHSSIFCIIILNFDFLQCWSVTSDLCCNKLINNHSCNILGGVAFQQTASGSGPYFLGEVNCRGNETSLFQCPIGGDECDSQFTSGNAGVLCYNQRSMTYFYNIYFWIIFVECFL